MSRERRGEDGDALVALSSHAYLFRALRGRRHADTTVSGHRCPVSAMNTASKVAGSSLQSGRASVALMGHISTDNYCHFAESEFDEA